MSASRHPARPDPAARYVMPTTPLGRLTLRTFNSTVAWLTRRGISVWGSRVLYLRGRTSGQWRSNPVNVLTYEGRRYLVAPRGQTQWVRNLRAAGGGELRVGRRVETVTATELADADKPAVLRERHGCEVAGDRTGPPGLPDQLTSAAAVANQG